MLPQSVPVAKQNSNQLVVLALVLGLVLGATTIGMIWFLSGRSASATEMPSDASRDAQAACALLVKVPPLTTPDFTGHGGYQLAGAASLAQAATTEDPHYQALSQALSQADVIVSQYPAGSRASDALANAREACSDL